MTDTRDTVDAVDTATAQGAPGGAPGAGVTAATGGRRWSWFVPPRHPSNRPSATGRDRITALDGLRAFALLIIMGYHFGVGWLQGGFFSLDIFYVLSGYLITGLLLGEWARKARIALGAFWARRARRLLPALFVVVVVVTLVVRFAYPPGLYPDLRMADLSALFYFSNWWQIAASGNYFVATGAVSPLTHTWSLAVEEQFYLVWPLVVVGVLSVARAFDRRAATRDPDRSLPPGERGIRMLLAVSAVGVVASAAEMAVRYHPGANVTRLYFGTDTHAQSILVGAVLACVLTLVQRHRGREGMAPTASSPRSRALLTAVGVAGFAGTLALTYLLDGTAAVDYRGGFLLSALSAAAIVLSAVCVAGGPVGRLLSLRPLVWMGTVSYGAYLWHFPVFIELDAGRTGFTGLPLLAVRFVATFLLAWASYRLVEQPVMERRFWRTLRAALPAAAATAATVAVVVAGTAVTGAGAQAVPTSRGIPAGEHQALRAAGAFGPHPVRFFLTGDSLAATLAVGLGTDTVTRYGVTLIDKSVLGCDLDDLPTISDTTGALDDPVSACTHWPTLWAQQVAAARPDVAGVLLGRWDILDHVDGTRIVHIGQPAWDRHLTAELEHVVQVLSSTGARVVFFTMPDIDPAAELLNGSLPPGDSPTRVALFNQLLRDVARRHPGRVSIIDLHRILGPEGHFQGTIDGVTVRWADGIHISQAGGIWLQPRILPTVAQLGLDVRAAGGP